MTAREELNPSIELVGRKSAHRKYEAAHNQLCYLHHVRHAEVSFNAKRFGMQPVISTSGGCVAQLCTKGKEESI
jgi:hypothetical protein